MSNPSAPTQENLGESRGFVFLEVSQSGGGSKSEPDCVEGEMALGEDSRKDVSMDAGMSKAQLREGRCGMHAGMSNPSAPTEETSVSRVLFF